MPLVPNKEMFKKGYGIGAFNVHSPSSVLPQYIKIINRFGSKTPSTQRVLEEILRKTTHMAESEMNIGSDLKLTMTAMVRKNLAENPGNFDPQKCLAPTRKGIKQVGKYKLIHILGCNNKI